jgi:CheY-like chemotaxis protein
MPREFSIEGQAGVIMDGFTNLASKVLLICNNQATISRIHSALETALANLFDIDQVGKLSEGLEPLREIRLAVVLPDLQLPDCNGLETPDRILNSESHDNIIQSAAATFGVVGDWMDEKS